ncbi:hypothetical protein D3C80_1022980 [compost metagenome]
MIEVLRQLSDLVFAQIGQQQIGAIQNRIGQPVDPGLAQVQTAQPDQPAQRKRTSQRVVGQVEVLKGFTIGEDGRLCFIQHNMIVEQVQFPQVFELHQNLWHPVQSIAGEFQYPQLSEGSHETIGYLPQPHAQKG